MLQTDPESESTRKKLRERKEALRRERERLEEIGLSGEEVDHALRPMISFQKRLQEEIDICEQVRQIE